MIDPATMPAGPEMDRLIAERVMGWTSNWMDRRYRPDEGDDCWEQRAAPSKEACKHVPVEHFNRREADGWKPSTDIASAWEVLERMAALGTRLGVVPGVEGWIAVEDCAIGEKEWASAPTAPLAICRAALLAVTASPPPPAR